MSAPLLKEVLAEAKQLRQIAEQNARNAIIEKITPTLKEMIEKQFLSEGMYEADDDTDILMDTDVDGSQVAPEISSVNPDLGGEMPMVGQELSTDVPGLPGDPSDHLMQAPEEAEVSLPDEEGKITLDLDALQPEEEVMLTREAIETLANLSGAQAEKFGMRTLRINKKLNALKEQKEVSFSNSEKLKQVKVEIESLYRDLKESKIPEETKEFIAENLEELYKSTTQMYVPRKLKLVAEDCKKIVSKARKMNGVVQSNSLNEGAKKFFGNECIKVLKEALVLYGTVAELNEAVENKKVFNFTNKVAKLCKEIFEMANKHGTLTEGELRLILKDLPDEVDVDTLSVDVEPAEGMGGEEDMDLDLAPGDEGDLESDEVMSMDAEEDDMEMPDLDEMDLAVDVDLPGDEEVDVSDATADVSALDDEGDMDSDMDMDLDMQGDDDEVVEISESMLKKELMRLRSKRLNESDSDVSPSAPKEFDGTDHGPKGQEDQFGGGHPEKEPFVDMDDADLNTLGESELSEMEMELDEMCDEEDDMMESKGRSRALAEQVKKYKKAASKLQKQLAEANLFNAKLVYANKLLSNKNLSQKQRATIINALDGAETVKEAKKLFVHLNEALSKKGKGKLTESRRVLGAGSRVSKSGSSSAMLNESDKKEFSRWGELAGI